MLVHITMFGKAGYKSTRFFLVGGIPTPLKNMSLPVGMMTFPTEWKVIKFMFQTTNQYSLTIVISTINHRIQTLIGCYLIICAATLLTKPSCSESPNFESSFYLCAPQMWSTAAGAITHHLEKYEDFVNGVGMTSHQ